MKKIFLGIVLIGLSISSIGQSAWTLEKDAWYTQVNYTTIGPYSNLFVDGDGSVKIPREVTDNTVQFYAEYGLDNKTTLFANIPIKLIKTGDEAIADSGTVSESLSALGNVGFGVKRKLYDNNFVVSGLLALEANTSTFDAPSGIRTGYDAWTVSPSVGIGKGTSNVFVQGNLGVDFRTNSYSHSFKGNIEGGYKFFNRLWLILHVDYIKSFENGDAAFPIENLNTLLYVNDQEYAGYTIKGIFEISDQIGVTGALGSAFSANLQARKAAINIGAYFKFSGKKNQ